MSNALPVVQPAVLGRKGEFGSKLSRLDQGTASRGISRRYNDDVVQKTSPSLPLQPEPSNVTVPRAALTASNAARIIDNAQTTVSPPEEIELRRSGAESPLPPVPTLSRTKKLLIGSSTMLTNFVSSASLTAVVMTVPSISRDFGISNLQAQWVTSAYGLAYGCCLLVSGRIADIYGRKFLYVGGSVFYILTSIGSPFVPDLVALCVIRALAGLGLAVAAPAAFGITAMSFPRDPDRTVAFSALALGNPLGAMVGTLLGGATAGLGGHLWSYLFLVLAGISVLPVIIGSTVVPGEWFPRGPKASIDWIGAGLITTALTLFAFSLTQSGVVIYGWKTPYIPAVFSASIAIFIAFLLFERHLEHHPSSSISRQIQPVVKLSLFTRQRGRIAAITFSSFAVFTCVPGWIYLTSVFYQDFKGLSPLANAVRLIPACISGMGAALLVIYLLPRMKASYIISIGAVLSGLSCLLFAVEPTGTNYWAYEMIAMLMIPFGADMATGTGSILISNLVKDEEQSVAGAVFQTSIQLAATFGICLSSLVANEQAKKSSLEQGLRDAFGMNVAWAWIVPVITLSTLSGMGVAQEQAVDRARESRRS